MTGDSGNSAIRNGTDLSQGSWLTPTRKSPYEKSVACLEFRRRPRNALRSYRECFSCGRKRSEGGRGWFTSAGPIRRAQDALWCGEMLSHFRRRTLPLPPVLLIPTLTLLALDGATRSGHEHCGPLQQLRQLGDISRNAVAPSDAIGRRSIFASVSGQSMLSSISTVLVCPSGAVTVIIPSLTLNRPDICLPSVSWKLIFSLILRFYRRRPGSPIRWHSEPVDDTAIPIRL